MLELLAELGIPREEMAKAGPPRHYYVESFLAISAGELDPDEVEESLVNMRAYLAAASC